MKTVKVSASPSSDTIYLMAEPKMILHIWIQYNEAGLFLSIFDNVHDAIGEQDEPQYRDMFIFMQFLSAEEERRALDG